VTVVVGLHQVAESPFRQAWTNGGWNTTEGLKVGEKAKRDSCADFAKGSKLERLAVCYAIGVVSGGEDPLDLNAHKTHTWRYMRRDTYIEL